MFTRLYTSRSRRQSLDGIRTSRKALRSPHRRFEKLETRAMLAGHGDFNGDGRDDLAIGVYREDLSMTLINAGAVQVIYGSSQGLKSAGNQFWTQNSSGVNGVAGFAAHFGFALAVGDFNGDGFDDLAIGAPSATVAGKTSAGSVNVLYGSKTGLTAKNDQLWTQDSSGINDTAEANDSFGYKVEAGDFNGDGRDDLAVGAYGDSVGTVASAGAVNVIYGSANGLTSSGDQIWTQNSSGINDLAEPSDSFGLALATGDFNHDGRDDLAVGVPFEDIGTLASAGAVNVIYGSSSGLTTSGDQFWNQDSTNIPDMAETGDQFGFALTTADFNGDQFDELVVGANFENSTGAVHVIYGSATKLNTTGTLNFDQTALGFSASLSQFGAALAAGDFNADGHVDLAIGAPQENGSAGAVYITYGWAGGLTGMGSQRWIQGPGPSGTLPDFSEASDFFGGALAAADFDGDGRADLAIGVRGENSSTGAVQVMYGFHPGLITFGNQFWDQSLLNSSNGNQNDDFFGGALA